MINKKILILVFTHAWRQDSISKFDMRQLTLLIKMEFIFSEYISKGTAPSARN